MNIEPLLGKYLIVIAILQSALYITYFARPGMDWLFYFDPRTGMDAWITMWRVTDETRAKLTAVSGALRWLSALWILLLGVLFLARRTVVRLYVISELVLSGPNVAFFALVLFVNISPAHGFSVPELALPVIIFLVFTVIPLCMGIQAWHKLSLGAPWI